jgi:hypothetical protein
MADAKLQEIETGIIKKSFFGKYQKQSSIL